MKGRILIMTMMKIDTLEINAKFVPVEKLYNKNREKNTTTNISRKLRVSFLLLTEEF